MTGQNWSNKSFCLLICLWFIVPLENFSLIWRRHHCRWRAANFDLCSALIAVEQWGFFNVPHLLWNRASVYNGHFRGPLTHTLRRAFSSGAVTSCFYNLSLSWLDSNTRLSACRANAQTECATSAVKEKIIRS